ERFLPPLDADRLLVDAFALGGELDQDPAAIVRVGEAADQAGVLEAVEPVRHRAARELHQPREPAGRAAVDLLFAGRQAKELPLRVVELELGESLVEGAVETAVESPDAVDDALDLGVEHWQPLTDRLEEAVDVVAFLGLRGHVRILDVKLLDVKLSVG